MTIRYILDDKQKFWQFFLFYRATPILIYMCGVFGWVISESPANIETLITFLTLFTLMSLLALLELLMIKKERICIQDKVLSRTRSETWRDFGDIRELYVEYSDFDNSIVFKKSKFSLRMTPAFPLLSKSLFYEILNDLRDVGVVPRKVTQAQRRIRGSIKVLIFVLFIHISFYFIAGLSNFLMAKHFLWVFPLSLLVAYLWGSRSLFLKEL